MDLEARDLARRLQQEGIAAFVLKYRTVEKLQPGIPEMDMDTAGRYGIADGIQALKVVRRHAREWGISAARVGIIGFSAGAMVASGTLLLPPPAGRPGFAAMLYGGPFGVMPKVTAGLPPTFLAWARDDSIAGGTETRLRDALLATGNHPEVHIYQSGGHGFGTRKQGTDSDRWVDDFVHWLRPWSRQVPSSREPTALPAPLPALGPGEALLPVRGGRIWYRVSGTGKGTPMVLLHGGPGAGSYYLKPFEDIGDDRPVIRYDQLGAGKSDRLTDTTLMNIPRFVEELDSLRRALGIDKWFVNGQSWGTVLALEYYKAHPEHVAAIVFGGSVFDWRAYVREVDAWTKQMTDSSQRAIAAWKQGGSPDAPAFKAATDEFYCAVRVAPAGEGRSRFDRWRSSATSSTTTCRARSSSSSPARSRTTMRARTCRRSRSRCSRRPASSTRSARRRSRRMRGSSRAPRFILYKDAAHVTSWDARDANVKDVREFLRSVDARR